VDHRRFAVECGQLDVQIAWLAGAAAEEQADADLPRLAILTCPMGDGHRAISRVVAKRPFCHDVLEPPWPDLDAMLMAQFEERAEAALQFACRPGQRAIRFQPAPGGTPF